MVSLPRWGRRRTRNGTGLQWMVGPCPGLPRMSISCSTSRRDTPVPCLTATLRVYPVGRLDVASEGLLLLTNDGDFAHAVLHPSHQVDKTYHVTVSGYRDGTEKQLAAVRALDGEPIQRARVRLLSRAGGEAVLEVVIHEGKKRQIRRMCRSVGLSVRRLCRIREGTLDLGDLPSGSWRYLTADEVAACKK